MRNIAVLREQDVFGHQKGDALNEPEFNLRTTVKAIAVFEGKICVVGNSISHLYTLPGGGVEDNETYKEAVVREVLEETGVNLCVKRKIGVIEDFRLRDKKHYLNYCYYGTVNRIGLPQLTDEEQENGLHHVWLERSEIDRLFDFQLKLLKDGFVKYYNTCFNIKRDQLFLKSFYEKDLIDWK